MTIDECLELYKKITLELMDKTKEGTNLEKLINEREFVLKRIGDIDFSKVDLKNKLDNLNIIELDKELQNQIKKEKVKTKKQIEHIKQARILRKNYNNSHETLRFFSAKS